MRMQQILYAKWIQRIVHVVCCYRILYFLYLTHWSYHRLPFYDVCYLCLAQFVAFYGK